MRRRFSPASLTATQPTALWLDRAALRRHQWENRLQSILLLAGLGLLAAVTGSLLAGSDGMLLAAGAALLLLLLEPGAGDPAFRYMFGAVPLHPAQAPELYALTRELARRAGLSRLPMLHLIPSRQLQAMAGGGRDSPAIALTTGLLAALPPREVAGVLAHEVAHLRHGDLRVMRLAAAAATLTRGMGLLGSILLLLWLPILMAAGAVPSPLAILLLVVAPSVGDLLTLSLSRRREFLADAGAVELTGDPAGLAAALLRLERLQGDDWERLVTRSGAWWLRWLRTHPTIRERVARLAGTVTSMPPVQAPPLDPVMRGTVIPQGHAGQRLARRWML
ncbi:M48 family metalloprotease [Roseomonas sp. E05]|uniref:M48 family metalloprotease n=1 Tax=Roseomonas sp. E05 TaxID=3046310 RepID=UPI0024B9C205|nr:M48 family metalloprotease [Roseomonas sp. E05]MDJ0390913.1 M48 family metalloprotease [Roseomonas sp. E05]